MKYHFVRIFLRTFAWAPLTISRATGHLLGYLWWLGGGNSARITRENLQLCLPRLSDKEQEQQVRKSLQQTMCMAMETPAVWLRGDDWRNRKIVGWENRELFDQALRDPRGILLLVPHFGNWEMAGMVASTRIATTAIYREPRLKEMNDLLKSVRDVGTTNMVPASSRGVMAVVKCLNRGQMTVILPDQEPTQSGGIFSPFFGVPALTMTLIHRLIQKTQPLVLIAYARRCRHGFILGYCQPDEDIYAADQQQSVDALNRSVEALIATAPEQYQWEYKRFRKRPAGEQKLYR